MPDGARIDMVATNGVLNTEGGLMTLDGGVNLTTTTGYSIQTQSLIAKLDHGVQLGAISANGPMGQIVADQMTLSQDPKQADAYLLVFNGHVKLLYKP